MKVRVIATRMPDWQKMDMVFSNVERTAAGVRELRQELEGGGMVHIEYMIDLGTGLYMFTEGEVEGAGWNSFGGAYKGEIWCYSVKDYSYRFEHILK